MNNLHTDKALLKALKESSSYAPTSDQIDRQRLSFVMGALPDGNEMTREEVQEVLERQEGRPLTLK